MQNDDRTHDAELRVNLVRIAAIAGFYAVHLFHVYGSGWGISPEGASSVDVTKPVANSVHVAVSCLALGWLMQAFCVHFLIQQRQVNDRWVMASTLGDLIWLTAVLALSTGPAGPMVAGYFLIIMLSGLRFDLRLVRITTIFAIVSYLVLLGAVKWRWGLLKEIAMETVPRYHQIMIVVALVFAGVIVGQTVRHAYTISRRATLSNQEVRL